MKFGTDVSDSAANLKKKKDLSESKSARILN